MEKIDTFLYVVPRALFSVVVLVFSVATSPLYLLVMWATKKR